MTKGAPNEDKEKKKGAKDEEESQTESMLEKAQTRHNKEKAFKRSRQESFEEQKTVSREEPARFMFDRQNLPPIVLAQIPYKMRANAH